MDGSELIQGGGLLAFVAAVYTMLRGHLAKVETILGAWTEAAKVQAVANTEHAAAAGRQGAALERMDRRLERLITRGRRTPAAGVPGAPGAAHGLLGLDSEDDGEPDTDRAAQEAAQRARRW